jgi:hypothetical protein
MDGNRRRVYFDDETCRREPIEDPFGPKVLPIFGNELVTHVTGIDRAWTRSRISSRLGLVRRVAFRR